MLFDIRYFYFWNSAKAGMLVKTQDLFRESRNVDENKRLIVPEWLGAQRRKRASIDPGVGIGPWQGPAGASKILNIENEGTSHDVVENKGRNFLSHDVYDK